MTLLRRKEEYNAANKEQAPGVQLHVLVYMKGRMFGETLPKFWQCLFLDHETSDDFHYLLCAFMICFSFLQ